MGVKEWRDMGYLSLPPPKKIMIVVEKLKGVQFREMGCREMGEVLCTLKPAMHQASAYGEEGGGIHVSAKGQR